MLFRLKLLIIYFTTSLLYSSHSLFKIELYKEDNSYIYLICNESIQNKIIEINSSRVFLENEILKISKNSLKLLNSLVIRDNLNLYKFEISNIDNKQDIYVNKEEYYIGYHIKSLKNNAICTNLLSKKVYFTKINNEINILDSFDFSLLLFTEIIIEKMSSISCSVDLFLNESVFPKENYSNFCYSFFLTPIFKDNKYIFLLDRNRDLKLPNNFNSNNFFVNLKINIDKVNFNISYKINIKYLLFDYSSYLKVEKEESDYSNYEKEIIFDN